ncbi:MAG: PAN domain-containing protein [Kofleriaceae bacterium]
MIKKTLFALLLASTATASAATGWLDGDELLMPGQSITVSCFYRATMGFDGNFVLTKDGDAGHVYWSSNTTGRGVYAKMQTDGNLVVYDWYDREVWTAWTQGNPGSFATMEDDGNLIIRSGDTYLPIWSTDTAGPSLGSSQCHGNFNKVSLLEGRNLAGGDYFHTNVPDGQVSTCAYVCAKESRCKAFTFVPAGIQGPTAVCWMKDGTTANFADSRMTSGIIRTNFSGYTY